MGKTRMWLAIYGIILGAAVLTLMASMLFSGADIAPAGMFGMSLVMLTVYYPWVPFPFTIYFMFRWTTAFNREHFGYASKGAWKEAQRDKEADLE